MSADEIVRWYHPQTKAEEYIVDTLSKFDITDIEELKSKVEALTEENDEYYRKNESLEDEVSRLESDNVNLEKQIEALQDEVSDLERERDELSETIEDLQNEIDILDRN